MVLDGDPGQWELKSSPSCQMLVKLEFSIHFSSLHTKPCLLP